VTHTVDRPSTAAGTSLSDLIDEYTSRAWALARRIVGDDTLAEDVVQEAFLAYWRDPAAFDGTRGTFGSWFLALVHHKAVDAVRREESHRRRADVAAQLAAQDTVRDVADTVADRITDLRVRSALEGLPALQREALVLAYWGGLTQREIAQRTGAPLGTVKTRMFAGMRRLQEGLRTVGGPSVVAPRVAGA
jgi:RNA polymerase sigma factor (sigma-70 family)